MVLVFKSSKIMFPVACLKHLRRLRVGVPPAPQQAAHPLQQQLTPTTAGTAKRNSVVVFAALFIFFYLLDEYLIIYFDGRNWFAELVNFSRQPPVECRYCPGTPLTRWARACLAAACPPTACPVSWGSPSQPTSPAASSIRFFVLSTTLLLKLTSSPRSNRRSATYFTFLLRTDGQSYRNMSSGLDLK